MKKLLSLLLATASFGLFSLASHADTSHGNWPYGQIEHGLTGEPTGPVTGRYCKVYVGGRVVATLSYERGYWKVYRNGRVTNTIAFERGYHKAYIDGRVRATISHERGYDKVYVDGRVVATGTWERGYGKVYVNGRVVATIEGDVGNCSVAVMTAGSVQDIGIGL